MKENYQIQKFAGNDWRVNAFILLSPLQTVW